MINRVIRYTLRTLFTASMLALPLLPVLAQETPNSDPVEVEAHQCNKQSPYAGLTELVNGTATQVSISGTASDISLFVRGFIFSNDGDLDYAISVSRDVSVTHLDSGDFYQLNGYNIQFTFSAEYSGQIVQNGEIIDNDGYTLDGKTPARAELTISGKYLPGFLNPPSLQVVQEFMENTTMQVIYDDGSSETFGLNTPEYNFGFNVDGSPVGLSRVVTSCSPSEMVAVYGSGNSASVIELEVDNPYIIH